MNTTCLIIKKNKGDTYFVMEDNILPLDLFLKKWLTKSENNDVYRLLFSSLKEIYIYEE